MGGCRFDPVAYFLLVQSCLLNFPCIKFEKINLIVQCVPGIVDFKVEIISRQIFKCLACYAIEHEITAQAFFKLLGSRTREPEQERMCAFGPKSLAKCGSKFTETLNRTQELKTMVCFWVE